MQESVKRDFFVTGSSLKLASLIIYLFVILLIIFAILLNVEKVLRKIPVFHRLNPNVPRSIKCRGKDLTAKRLKRKFQSSSRFSYEKERVLFYCFRAQSLNFDNI